MTRAVVVAPHPDDEVLGCSSVLFDASTTVIHVTDGVPPWTPTTDCEGLRSIRQAECSRAWKSLSSHVDSIRLGFDDLMAWQAVEEISYALSEVISSVGAAHVYLPAYQRGHPDHDASYLAGALSRGQMPDTPGLVWWVYGLYGFDRTRRLRFGWLPPEIYDSVEVPAPQAPILEVKGRALGQFTSQIWPGSALDVWLRSPVEEVFAPLPTRWSELPDLPCFYDEELGFGRYGASVVAVEAAFHRALDGRDD